MRNLYLIFLLSSALLAQSDFSILIKTKNKKDFETIKAAKINLIAGRSFQAQKILNNIDTTNTKYKNIINYYDAIIDFIGDNHQHVLDKLSKIKTGNIRQESNICFLGLTSSLLQKNKESFEMYYKKCKVFNLQKSRNDGLWPNKITSIFLGTFHSLTDQSLLEKETPFEYQELERIKLLLKLNLYFGNNKLSFEKIPETAFKSNIAREIAGMIKFLEGDYDKSLTLISDLSTSNAENIKGMIEINKQRNEIALGHFLLAQKRKNNSQNALNKIIPLAWSLKKWDLGLDYIIHPIDRYNTYEKNLLKDSFKIMVNDIDYLKKTDGRFRKKSKINRLVEVNKAFLLNNESKLKKLLEKGCQKFDGISCWLLVFSNSYASPIQLKNSDIKTKIAQIDFKDSLVEKEEEIIIDQKDIKHLDKSYIYKKWKKTFQ